MLKAHCTWSYCFLFVFSHWQNENAACFRWMNATAVQTISLMENLLAWSVPVSIHLHSCWCIGHYRSFTNHQCHFYLMWKMWRKPKYQTKHMSFDAWKSILNTETSCDAWAVRRNVLCGREVTNMQHIHSKWPFSHGIGKNSITKLHGMVDNRIVIFTRNLKKLVIWKK